MFVCVCMLFKRGSGPGCCLYPIAHLRMDQWGLETEKRRCPQTALKGTWQEGQYCRRDAQCVRGLSCMFGRCIRSIPDGQEGARCKLDRDCGASMCCARHHGERVCKRRLVLGESCFVPDGGLAFSINQICPCDEGLLCRGHGEPLKRAREFVYQPESTSWTCQAPKP
ncbi:dickkopf-related protein 3-like isoform X3 [Myxocyprinus asiaticus]|uniref:dickkopf-related protein 3-like isoform X3 n=1 Tax=Myxocyprinus asiaticus TaxID=70543 RepID=UPI0022224CEC|nr:dickkopf-related protein 3-like isoform X3 [Myxocyprinus asiaticus]